MDQRATPAVYTFFIVYCVLMALLCLASAVLGIALMFTEPDADMSATEAKLIASMLLVVGIVLFVAYGLAPFLPRKSGVWVFGLVLICLGLTSSCCLPACIPLLIFWMKPEMKAFYGRTPITLPPSPPPPPQWN